ncbi:hypothetical protein GCM10023174_07460 [Chelativorans composti]
MQSGVLQHEGRIGRILFTGRKLDEIDQAAVGRQLSKNRPGGFKICCRRTGDRAKNSLIPCVHVTGRVAKGSRLSNEHRQAPSLLSGLMQGGRRFSVPDRDPWPAVHEKAGEPVILPRP